MQVNALLILATILRLLMSGLASPTMKIDYGIGYTKSGCFNRRVADIFSAQVLLALTINSCDDCLVWCTCLNGTGTRMYILPCLWGKGLPTPSATVANVFIQRYTTKDVTSY